MAFAGLDVGTSGAKLLVYDLDGAISVSYTHLDVYKRQVQKLMC